MNSNQGRKQLVDPEKLARRWHQAYAERERPRQSSPERLSLQELTQRRAAQQRKANVSKPVLADALLTTQQRMQSKYQVNLSAQQVQQARLLLDQKSWDLSGLSWYNITLFD